MNIFRFSKTYNNKCVLDFPGAKLEKGKIYALIGANGSGKSTFAKILAGVEKADNNVRVLDDICVGYMPQKSYAFRLSLLNNLLLNGSDEKRADYYINKLNLTSLKRERADKFSGGETAKMALARLMMNTYDIIVLDEPTASMDIESTRIAEEIVSEYAETENCAVIFVTHSIQQARRVSDYIWYFDNGMLEESGNTSDVLSKPTSEKTANFLMFFGI